MVSLTAAITRAILRLRACVSKSTVCLPFFSAALPHQRRWSGFRRNSKFPIRILRVATKKLPASSWAPSSCVVISSSHRVATTAPTLKSKRWPLNPRLRQTGTVPALRVFLWALKISHFARCSSSSLHPKLSEVASALSIGHLMGAPFCSRKAFFNGVRMQAKVSCAFLMLTLAPCQTRSSFQRLLASGWGEPAPQ